ncbi:MAG TPA: HEAT repeat domain-containing protein [Pseudomonadales bacterium]|nr:HEAT repeat domain-containing protein [Pseudomonadales bacterium]
MRFNLSMLALAVVVAALPACDKQKQTEPTAEKSNQATTPASQSAFQRNGELLSVNVDAMPRAAFVAKMAELTGVKITAEGDNNQLVTVHAVDVSLRKILSMAIADAPYAVTMQYTNLQDSFPANVTVTRYQSGAQLSLPAQARPVNGFGQHLSAAGATAVPTPAAVEEVADGPDITTMKPDEQVSYFLGQPSEEQVSIIFNMEPTAAEAELMSRLMAKNEVSSEVKLEILDSLSNSEYGTGEATIKMAMDSPDPEVATKAVEVLAELGSDKDIPALKSLAEKTTDEDVRTAVNDAIEALQP